MALLQECPTCQKRVSMGRKVCFCGVKLAKSSGKVYWIEYYVFGRRKRERIGPNKSAAEQRLREVLKLRTEERFIDKDPAARLTLGELCTWYLALPEVKAKDSYSRDEDSINNLKRLLGESTKVKDITSGRLESYQRQRLEEPSPHNKKPRPNKSEGNNPIGDIPIPLKKITPASVNRETSCIKTIFNRAIRHGKLQHNPLSGLKKLPENNTRMRTLTEEEIKALLGACADHIRPIIMIAYYMGLRRSEILNLTWPEVDIQKGFIRLSAERTKTDQARAIPIHPRVQEVLKGLPRGLHTDRVFLLDGMSFEEFRKSFKSACRKARIEDFVFHDLRHCALNNLRLAGNDYFRIMALSGHRTMSCFKRYNLVTEGELAAIKWPAKGEEIRSMDTYMDTKEKWATGDNP
jgi:integrase